MISLETIVLLRSEINRLSKTIDTSEFLLKAFVHLLQGLDTPSLAVRAAITKSGAELRVEAQNQKILLSIRPQLHPSRKILAESSTSEDKPFLLVSPHIPDDLAADLRKQAVNHADLNGRLFIQTPWFLLDREPKAGRYRNPVAEPDLFSLKTSRLVRALLSHRDKTWTQDELTERTKVSRGLVSRVLNSLTQQGYVARESTGTRHAPAPYRLAEFDRLLDAWRTADAWSKRVSLQQYSLLTNDAGEIARTVRDALGEENAVFTQWFAAHVRHPYTTPPVVSAYVPKERRLPELQWARAVPTGGNLWLIAPEDEGVFFETQERDGFRLVSDVQIYLDLLQMGQRGPDAAEALRAWDGFAR